MRKWALFTIIFLISILVHADWYNFVNFTDYNHILENNNYVYISSSYGLGKYNILTNSFLVLTSSDGIYSNKIECITKSNDNLYILHKNGITVINPDSVYVIPLYSELVTDEPDRIYVNSTSIYINSGNSLLIGHFDGISYNFQKYNPPFGHFSYMTELADTLVISSDSGIIFSPKETPWDSTTWYKHIKDELLSSKVNYLSIFNKKLFIATDQGVNTYFEGLIDTIPNTNLTGTDVTYFSIIDNKLFIISSSNVYYYDGNLWIKYHPLRYYNINEIVGNDSVNIAINNQNIYKIDTCNIDTSGNIVVDKIERNSLTNNGISAIKSDKEGNLYILYGFLSNHIDLLDNDTISSIYFPSDINTRGIYSIDIDNQNRPWIGFWDPCDSGIVNIDEFGNFHWYKFPADLPTVSDIKFDNKGKLWLINYSDYSNLFLLNEDNSWTKYNNPNTGWMYRLYFDKSNNLWMGSYYIGAATCFDTSGIWHRILLTGAATVSGFAEIDDSTMYISTESGIYVIRNYTVVNIIKQDGNISLTDIIDMTLDPYGNLWIAKNLYGIYVKRDNLWLNFQEKDGLISNNMGSASGGIKKPQKLFSFDRKNNFMYIATLGGLSRFYNDGMFIIEESNFSLKLFPNPVRNGILFAELVAENVIIYVYSLNGKKIGRFSPSDINSKMYFNTSNLRSGIYMAIATINNKRISETKFAIINK